MKLADLIAFHTPSAAGFLRATRVRAESDRRPALAAAVVAERQAQAERSRMVRVP